MSAIAPDIKVRPKDRKEGHPHPYLHGNFYPVFEETIGDEGIECEVIGKIPESLRGSQYVRTGPNSLHVADDGVPHHFFDGEGMLHGVYFEPGNEDEPIRARYMNRWVRSEIFKKANKYGRMNLTLGLVMAGADIFWGVLLWHFWYRLKAAFFKVKNFGNGNTALAFFGSRLLALNEGGKPIETSVPSLNTTGEYFFEEEEEEYGEKKEEDKNTLEKKIKESTPEVCTAHPKIDPKTGEFIFFSYRFTYPFMYYSVVAADGKHIVWQEPIKSLKKSIMMHDFAITPSYSIIMGVPLFISTKHKKEGKPVISFDPKSPTRFGIIPRYYDSTKDEIIWFNSRACHIFHTANAWEEKDEDGKVIAVCLTACRSERFISDINLWQPTNTGGYGGGKTQKEYEREYSAPGSGSYATQDPDAAYMTLFRFDFKTRETQITTLSTASSEFPIINFNRYMQPDLRYVFGATIAPSSPGVAVKFNGIIKTDIQAVLKRRQELLSSGLAENEGGEGCWELGAKELKRIEEQTGQIHIFGPHIYAGEALFVPNSPREDGKELEEDDGHLLVYVYDERQMENGLAKANKQVTELWIFDAKNIGQDIEPVAKVRIPRRVPYGFHGLHVTREQIQANKDMLERRNRHH
ncbi:hypothetical protein BX616_011099 [Lobosporangium transversale]|uniref:Carotenoid oxygenase n=1 Tax=Lobosporangium transversale TaxID=64571 RepID=A0A1Y2GXR8_9FUNG|nr:carotenoid oxygenase [Lobosporangium transversale]KAF9909668.1 hypothetical protein BX616_011099 [Lobosporangium transversale]ORZ27077.1 carotenoid oxygenase [Lobosporangium transversale]|eukprot:XP_021884824.1 carotenoid oxygenase [Lobosporangium transversale]